MYTITCWLFTGTLYVANRGLDPLPNPASPSAHFFPQVTLSVPQTRWLSISKSLLGATNLQSQSRISQLSQITHDDSSSPFTMRGLAAMTMASTLGGKGGVADVRMSGNLPRHTTDVYQLQRLLQELMLVYSIGGVSLNPPQARGSSHSLCQQKATIKKCKSLNY